MLLSLNRIRGPRERFEKVYEPEAFQKLPDGDTYRIAAPVSLSFDIFKDKEMFRTVGNVRTTLELPCSRCLEPFTLPLDASFDLCYQPQTMNAGEGEREIEQDDLSTAFYSDDEIDLGQLMREQFYLALPMKPLCRADCRGLCPICGVNLNRGSCSCNPQWDDPRLAALRNVYSGTKTQD